MTKKLGRPVRGSTTGRPIMVLLDVLGQKWTLRILWELKSERATFRSLREKCEDVSPTILNKRLKELRSLNIVDLNDEGFGLTQQGRELAQKFIALDSWAAKWAGSLDLTS